MDRETILALAAAGQGEVERLSRELGKPIDVDGKALVMLGRIAIHQPDGEGYMRARVRDLVEDLIRRAPEAASYNYEYEPPDADARRQAGHVPPNITFLA